MSIVADDDEEEEEEDCLRLISVYGVIRQLGFFGLVGHGIEPSESDSHNYLFFHSTRGCSVFFVGDIA